MRNLIIILVLVAAIGGGYTLFWHKKADEVRQAVIQSVDALNAQAKPYTKDMQVLRYDSVTVTGFPFAMNIEVSKPVLDIPVSAILLEVEREKGVTAPSPFEWVEEMAYQGNVLININLTGDKLSYTIPTDVLQKALINKAVRHSTLAHYSAPVTCHGEISKKSMFWSGMPSPAELAQDFHDFDCTLPQYSLKDSASGAELMSGDGYYFSLTHTPEGTINHKLGFRLDINNMKSTAAFDTVVKDYVLMAYTLLGKPQEAGAVFPTSEFGEQNVAVDMAYDGPLTTQTLMDPNLKLHFDINSLNINNALENVDYQMHISDAPQGDDRAVSFSMHGTQQVTERYDMLNQQHYVDVLKSMGNTSATDPGAVFFRKLTMIGTPEDTVAKLYPKGHLFGKTSTDIDINAKAPNKGLAQMRQGVLTIDNLNWVSVPYGVKTKGSLNASVPQKPPTADVTLNCISCDSLVVDLGNYAMRAESIFDQLGDAPKAPHVSKGLIDGIRLFLHGISENSAATDLVIHVSMKDTGMFTVSNKQLPEVMQLYMTDIAPFLPQKPEIYQ